jgi:translation initiation factor 1
MAKKSKRIDTAGPASSLTSNPFAQLGETKPETHQEAPPQAPQPKPKANFTVGRTKKGDYPIFMEKRAAGKSVTIIRNLSGDTEALLALLKKHCAAGGKAFADSVEIQGDHRDKVRAFLRERGF